MTDRPLLRRLLWGLTALCLLAAVAAVPLVGDGDQRPSVRSGAAGATGGEEPVSGDAATEGDGEDAGRAGVADDAAGGAEAPTGLPGAAPAATAAGMDPAAGSPPTVAPGSTTTLAPPPEGLGAPVDPGPPVAPRPGVYRYRTTGGRDGDGESTTRVDERGRAGDEVRLSVTVEGSQMTTTSDVVWRPDGVRTLRSTLTFGDRSGECDWEPDVVDAVFPLQVGATWRTESSCAVSGLTPAPITLQRTSSAKVLELRRTQVAGRTVDVWAIERTEKLAGAGMAEEITVVALFSPKHGLDVDVRGSRSGREYRRELLGLEPS